MGHLTHRAIFKAAKAKQRTRPSTKTPGLPHVDLLFPTITIAVGRFISGGRILSPWQAPACSQNGIIHTSGQCGWSRTAIHTLFMSLKVNLSWKYLLTPSLSMVPFTVVNPGRVCASSEALLRCFCKCGMLPVSPCPSAKCAQASALLLNFSWLTCPMLKATSLPFLLTPIRALVSTGSFTTVCVSTFHS